MVITGENEMMKTLEQINQEFLDEIADEKATENNEINFYGSDEWPAEPEEDFAPGGICSLEDIQKAIGIPLAAKTAPAPVRQASGKGFAKRMADVLFYVIIAFVLIMTLMFGGKTNEGFHLLGYSGFTVLSGSMQREIPEGSLVITKSVDPAAIEVGDDITFVREDNLTITHRVVSIMEDYENSGSRGFQTQGVENPEPDLDVVHAANVIGLVKFSIPELGYTLSYASEHIGIVFAVLGGILVATVALGKVFSRREDENEESLDMEKAA